MVPGLLYQLRLPTVQSAAPNYIPTVTEAMLTIGSFTGLALVVYIFTKLFPPVPAWELSGVIRLRTSPPFLFSLKSVFLAWAVGISMSAGFVFLWSVFTLGLGRDSALYLYAVRLQDLQILQSPLLTNNADAQPPCYCSTVGLGCPPLQKNIPWLLEFYFERLRRHG